MRVRAGEQGPDVCGLLKGGDKRCDSLGRRIGGRGLASAKPAPSTEAQREGVSGTEGGRTEVAPSFQEGGWGRSRRRLRKWQAFV